MNVYFLQKTYITNIYSLHHERILFLAIFPQKNKKVNYLINKNKNQRYRMKKYKAYRLKQPKAQGALS